MSGNLRAALGPTASSTEAGRNRVQWSAQSASYPRGSLRRKGSAMLVRLLGFSGASRWKKRVQNLIPHSSPLCGGLLDGIIFRIRNSPPKFFQKAAVFAQINIEIFKCLWMLRGKLARGLQRFPRLVYLFQILAKKSLAGIVILVVVSVDCLQELLASKPYFKPRFFAEVLLRRNFPDQFLFFILLWNGRGMAQK